MENTLRPHLKKIRTLINHANIPQTLDSGLGSKVSKNEILSVADELISLAGTLEAHPKYKPTDYQIAYMSYLLNSTSNQIAKIVNTPSLAINNVAWHLHEITKTLSIWNAEIDPKAVLTHSPLLDRLVEISSAISSASTLNDDIRRWHDELAKLIEPAKQNFKLVEEISAGATANAKITSTAQAEVSELKRISHEDFAHIKTKLSDLDEIKNELDLKKLRQNDIFKEFEDQREKVSTLLGDANRTGMASAFVQRRDSLEKQLYLWAAVFVSAIIGLLLLAYNRVSAGGTLIGSWDIWLSGLPIAAPLVWLGWFSVRQYGYTARLREDYAYKAASAMSFEGYKREAGEVSADMKQKLMDIAISNFADNPLRIFGNNSDADHATPGNQDLDQLLKEAGVLEKLKLLIKT